jgi:hypothetical protein
MKNFPIAVVIEKARLENRWASEKWEAIGVIPAFDAAVDAPPRRIFADEQREHFLAGISRCNCSATRSITTIST